VFPPRLNQWGGTNRELQQRRKEQFGRRPSSQQRVGQKLKARVDAAQKALDKALGLQEKRQKETRDPIQTYAQAASEAQEHLGMLMVGLGGRKCQP
jgi:predicted ribosome quality control (RQC) complex YloA/Tae2 family protein